MGDGQREGWQGGRAGAAPSQLLKGSWGEAAQATRRGPGPQGWSGSGDGGTALWEQAQAPDVGVHRSLGAAPPPLF